MTIEELIESVTDIAKEVMADLGVGWNEAVYQKAMEVALRERGIPYEEQRNVMVTYHGYNVGNGQVDLLPFIQEAKGRLYLVVDLDATASLKQGDRTQVIKYICELQSQVLPEESVYGTGLKINFCKSGEGAKIKDGMIEEDGIQVLHCASLASLASHNDRGVPG